jgi:ubiquinone/menaquinone biosynthesis C-methylase UbiE
MKTLEESITAVMDTQQDTAIIHFLPYILQDFWEIGTPPEIVIELIQRHCFVETERASSLRVLDLGCGKGAVSVKIAATFACHCYGIDGIPEFIQAAKEKANEYGVDELCRFEVGDVRKKIEELDKFDVIILGGTGPIYDDYYTALTTFSKHLTDEGIIIIEEAYVDDSSSFQHPALLPRKELLKQFGRAGMKLTDETVRNYNEFADNAKEMENIIKRCDELKVKYPERFVLFDNYAQNQAYEYDILENKVLSIMVLKKQE